MNEVKAIQLTENYNERFFRKRYISRIAFALGMLLFLMPFAEFKCGSVAMLGNTGIGIATGSSWKVASGWGKNEFWDKIKATENQGKDMMKDSPNIFAIVSLVAAFFGLIISFTNFKWKNLAAMCAGILAALMLLAVMIQFKIEMRALMKEGGGKDEMGMAMGGMLKMQFTFWYYLSLFCFIAAAFLNYMYDRLILRDAINASMDFEFQGKEERLKGRG